MDELNKKFIEWSDMNSTRLNRQLSITSRHVANMLKWVEMIETYPAFPVEEKEMVLSLHAELSNIYEETKELFFDMADDAERFKGVLDLMQVELQKLPND